VANGNGTLNAFAAHLHRAPQMVRDQEGVEMIEQVVG
jgi:hypothetical protein